MTKRLTESQIVGIMKEAEAWDTSTRDLPYVRRRSGFTHILRTHLKRANNILGFVTDTYWK